MIIKISDSILAKAGLTPDEVRLKLAILLFQEERMTLVQASKLAGLHQIQFQKELGKRKIPIHYGEEEFKRDLNTLKEF
jgi:predicted HTH domain antitoxin